MSPQECERGAFEPGKKASLWVLGHFMKWDVIYKVASERLARAKRWPEAVQGKQRESFGDLEWDFGSRWG